MPLLLSEGEAKNHSKGNECRCQVIHVDTVDGFHVYPEGNGLVLGNIKAIGVPFL
jgi:hypothetical protein